VYGQLQQPIRLTALTSQRNHVGHRGGWLGHPQGCVVAGNRAVTQAPVMPRRRRPFGAGSADPHGHQGGCGIGRPRAEVVGDRQAAIAVHHVDNHDAADEIGAALTARLPQIESLFVTDMGPALSIHVGGVQSASRCNWLIERMRQSSIRRASGV
jgi:hypothetical protein